MPDYVFIVFGLSCNWNVYIVLSFAILNLLSQFPHPSCTSKSNIFLRNTKQQVLNRSISIKVVIHGFIKRGNSPLYCMYIQIHVFYQYLVFADVNELLVYAIGLKWVHVLAMNVL